MIDENESARASPMIKAVERLQLEDAALRPFSCVGMRRSKSTSELDNDDMRAASSGPVLPSLSELVSRIFLPTPVFETVDFTTFPCDFGGIGHVAQSACLCVESGCMILDVLSASSPVSSASGLLCRTSLDTDQCGKSLPQSAPSQIVALFLRLTPLVSNNAGLKLHAPGRTGGDEERERRARKIFRVRLLFTGAHEDHGARVSWCAHHSLPL